MLTTRALLAAVKAAQGIPSDYRLARFLDVSDNTVGNWQHGRSLPNDEMVIRLSELARLDPAEALAAITAERASEGPAREIWQRIAQRLAAAPAALAVVILSAGVVASPDASAMAHAPQSGASVYIMSTGLRSILRRAAAAVRRMVGAPLAIA